MKGLGEIGIVGGRPERAVVRLLDEDHF